jgi:hypothetical protein
VGASIVKLRTLPVIVPLELVTRVRNFTVLPTAKGPRALGEWPAGL